MQNLFPLSIYEADVALLQAWPDGRRMSGPLPAHLSAGAEAKFRTGLSITRRAEAEAPMAFGDWRHEKNAQGMGWRIEFRQPFGSLIEASGAHVSNFIEPGREFTLLVRYLDRDTGHWQLLQFHHTRISGDHTISGDREVGEHSYSLESAWMESFRGTSTSTLPALEPREWGVIEWEHAGRCVPCWYYDPSTETLIESGENAFTVNGGTERYITIHEDGDVVGLSYMTPRTLTVADGAGPVDMDRTALGWLDALAVNFDSAGIHPVAGWTLQTSGCPEPLTIDPSARHWPHARVRIRFLGRLYATISHGVIAIPSVSTAPPDTPPIDQEIAIHPKVPFLPEGAYLLP